ncbi:hypothetical protein LPTSP4_34990 [Leptospira ryugenii]|uniref:Uncharacterized protein n=1 Tax=Leptospira ryugenii TaxID=1917863 RepID=A0A2P2E500_9LEPT|nr:hypothetical protein LPTSP4_34990 [Leptospira ryugenii]
MFNPFKDHERYLEKDPKDMSLDELRMLLKIRRLDLSLEWNEFQSKLRFWQRVGRSIKQSGLLEQILSKFSPSQKEDSSSSN